MLNFMKIRPVGAELFDAKGGTDERTDGRTGMMKIVVTFNNFANARRNSAWCPLCL
jgi:hypothetical protein